MKPIHHRATEAHRARKKADSLLPSSSSVPTVYSLQSTVCLAVPALFLFLFGIASAPAQTTTTLLDIRSPATADPPTTSLLTVSDAGDLWIRGALVEYAYPGTITLDPSRQYWTLRDSDGNILWALELYNPSTGVSTGNLLTVGTFESYCYDAEQDDAIFRVKTTAGLTVLSLNPLGRLLATGLAPVRLTPTSTPPPSSYTPLTPDAYASAPDFRDDLAPYLAQVAQPPHNEIRCPIPQAQARIYFAAPSGNSQRQLHDVTNMSWRRRWDPDKTTLADYDVVRYGVRSVNANSLRNQSILEWAWAVYDPGLQKLDVYEYDVKVYWNENSQAGDWMGVVEVAWSVVPANPPPAVTSPGRVHITATLQDFPQDPGYDDPDATLESDLFLYTVDFTNGHPEPGSIPRNDLDPRQAVHVGCQLVPANTPNLDYIELTLWDPAYVDGQGNRLRRRVFRSDTDPIENRLDIVSATWDGRLWTTEDGLPDPENPYDYYYTQASDIFMEATVHWVALDPQRPWETADNNAFPEDRYAIIVSDGTQPVSSTRTNFAWISATPQMPQVSATLVGNGGVGIPGYPLWSVTIICRRGDKKKMEPDVDYYYAPSSEGTVWDDMRAVMNGAIRGGNVRLYCMYESMSLRHDFCIRGLNPSDSDVLTTISLVNDNAYGGVHWYASAIAKHESHLAAGVNYNQFYPQGWQGNLPDTDPHKLDCPGNPVHHHDSGGSIGYGIMQITDPPATAEQIWNWKANINQGFVIMDYCWDVAEGYLPLLAGTEPTSMTIAGVYLTNTGNSLRVKDLEVIQQYNAGPFSHFFVPDTPDDNDLYWNVNVTLRHPATDPRWRNGTPTTNPDLWSYPERVLGQPD